MPRPRSSIRLVLTTCALGVAGGAVCGAETPEQAGWFVTAEMRSHQRLQELIAQGAPLVPFTTDGCSGGMSWLWSRARQSFPTLWEVDDTNDPQRPEWERCCVIHDRAYHDAADTRAAHDSFQARLTADRALALCIANLGRVSGSVPGPEPRDETPAGSFELHHAYEALSQAMFWAVRFGGGPCSGLPWRWGYGYPAC